jgi:hypothetical protein
MLGACAGSGEGLDENGRPVSDAAAPLEASFDSIQDHVFTPFCTGCHSGAAAPLGLRLDAGASYALLVNASSVEVPSLNRVQPGNPDSSYLVQKLEGTAAVGGRMPLDQPPLPQSTIAVVRQWIAEGAVADTAMSQKRTASSVQLTAIAPQSDEILHASPREIVLSANASLDLALLQADLVTLRASGGDGAFDDGNEVIIPIARSTRSATPTVLTFELSLARAPVDLYELRVRGSPPLGVADVNGTLLDGDRDGVPGGDFVLRFAVEELR